jgi:hypothetical protein
MGGLGCGAGMLMRKGDKTEIPTQQRSHSENSSCITYFWIIAKVELVCLQTTGVSVELVEN